MDLVSSRPHRQGDLTRLLDLVLANRLATGVKVYPTTWRVRLLLSSRVGDPRRDVRVWEGEGKDMVAFAMLWRRERQDAYLVLEHFIHPSMIAGPVFTDILDWGSGRAREISGEEVRPLVLLTAEPAGDSRSDLGSRGFTPLALDPQQRNAYFARDLGGRLPTPNPPDGFSIRAVTRLEDMSQYEVLYGFAPVAPEHRRTMIESDEYALFVACDPAGVPCAYCECSISRAEWERDAGRIGWIDYVGTSPSEQKKGLGYAVMIAALDRLQRWGADQAMLITRSDNLPAAALYRSAGFAPVEVDEPKRYQRHIARAQRQEVP